MPDDEVMAKLKAAAIERGITPKTFWMCLRCGSPCVAPGDNAPDFTCPSCGVETWGPYDAHRMHEIARSHTIAIASPVAAQCFQFAQAQLQPFPALVALHIAMRSVHKHIIAMAGEEQALLAIDRLERINEVLDEQDELEEMQVTPSGRVRGSA